MPHHNNQLQQTSSKISFCENKSSSSSILEKLEKQNGVIEKLINKNRTSLVNQYKKGRENLENKLITKFIKFVEQQNVETVILSIGSADSLKQQCPKFVSEKEKSKTAMLNMDPGLPYKGPYDSIFYIPGAY